MKFEKVSPLTGETSAVCDYALIAKIEMRIEKLHAAFLVWKQKSFVDRQKVVSQVIARMMNQENILAQLITKEMGKPITQSLAEVKKCIESTKSLCEMNLDFLQTIMINQTQQKSLTYKQSQISVDALGIIYAIMPWNFPLWQAIRMIIPALISGNVIYLKHSEVTSEMGDQIEKLFEGLFEEPLLYHDMIEHSFTEKILSDQRVGGVSLTGSTKAGLSVSKEAQRGLKKYVLELGGSDPYIVCADADLPLAAKLVAQSRLQNTGQSCIAAKRCIVDHQIKDDFLSLIKSEFQKYQFGDPFSPQSTLGPLAHPRFKKALELQLTEFKTKTHAECVFRLEHQQSTVSAFTEAQIFLLKENNPWLSNQEFFSPNLLVIPYTQLSEAISIANSTDYGLGAGVFSKDAELSQKIALQIESGQVAINDFIRSESLLPFGGVKLSGVGRELGHAGFLEFTKTRVISRS